MTLNPVFLVEDDPDDEALILRTFKKGNLANEVVVARDGAEALDRLYATGAWEREAPLNPAVVLLDLKLPKLDGIEVLERIRGEARTKRLPVVILTSSDEQEDMLRSYELNVNSYVRKPVDFTRFSEVVAELGVYWLMINEIPEGI